MEELMEITQSRKHMYSFLERLYREEVDLALMSHIGQQKLIEYSEEGSELIIGYGKIKEFSREVNQEKVQDLRVEFARIFLGMGPKQVKNAFPYESVYTSPKGLMLQDAYSKVIHIYQEEGLVKDASFKEPEDHIALEFAYLGYLCDRIIDAIEQEDMELVENYLNKQQWFIQEHILNWVPSFCDDVLKIAKTPFYLGLAQMTKGYLALEEEFLAELIA